MFVAEGMAAEAGLREQREVDIVISSLTARGFRPLLRTMLAAIGEIAQASLSSIPVQIITGRNAGPYSIAGIAGDLLFKDDLGYVVQPMDSSSLHVWQIRHHACQADINDFCRVVEATIRQTLDGRRVRGMNFTWRPIKGRSHRTTRRFYNDPKLETKPADYSVDEAAAARLLVASEIRAFVLHLAQAGKARAIDTTEEAKKLNLEELLQNGLVRREYLVSCRKDSHTICTVHDPKQLGETGGTLTCTTCGRAFQDECVHEIYVPSDGVKALLAGSRWMTIWVTELLLAAGVPKETIGWNATSGEDEIDIVVDGFESRVFLELKDREFGLGDAYPFAYRLSRYGGSTGIIVTMDKVADEAKKFFDEQRRNRTAQLLFAEGQATIEQEIRRHVDSVSRTAIANLVAELTRSLQFDTAKVMLLWMQQVARRRVTPNTGGACQRRPES